MLTVILAVLLFILVEALSFGVTVGLLYLISLCFSLQFNILVATGIWLIIELIRPKFKK